MNYTPEFAAVADLLGDKVLDGLAEAARRTRGDLAEYRSMRPGWVADHSERGLANWIHDRLWRHIQDIFDSVPGVTLYESGVTREVVVNSQVRIRIKRHHLDGRVSSAATQTALDFYNHPVAQLTFDGMSEIRLASGYEWDIELRQMGRAVLSLRESRRRPIWVEELKDRGAPPAPTPLVPSTGPSTPSRPGIDVGGVGEREADNVEHQES